ncbi:MAG: alginate lyase family protein [Chloroflexota bacterium]
MFSPQHFGLTFTDWHVQRARQNRRKVPYERAWEQLTGPSDQIDGAGGSVRLLLQAMVYRFNADVTSGAQAVDGLQMVAPDQVVPDLGALAETGLLAQVFELLRDHPAWTATVLNTWQDGFRTRLEVLNNQTDADDVVQALWLGVVNTAGGILLDDERYFDAGTNALIHAIDEEVHPEGYLRRAVRVNPETQSLLNQVLAVQAMVLIAEMASHAGRDLWRYDNRGVAVTTATTYPLYYYFYPEQWRWHGDEWRPSEGVRPDDAQAIFKQHAGFLEIANNHYDKPLKAIRLMLDDLRPVFDPYGGGPVTLSHGLLVRRGLFG